MSTKKNLMSEALKKASEVSKPPAVMQRVSPIEEPKKTGRTKHLPDGETARIAGRIPASLKTELDMAMLTTHKEYKTYDLFLAEAVRVFLAMKR
jgi:hypothetical protein